MYGDMVNQWRGVGDHRTATKFLPKCCSSSAPNTYIVHFAMNSTIKILILATFILSSITFHRFLICYELREKKLGEVIGDPDLRCGSMHVSAASCW